MTPEQIIEQLDNITCHIADALDLIDRLGKSFNAAAKANQYLDVVYSDIWTDARLFEVHKSLRIMEIQLARSQNITLPEHFDRLRSGTP